MFLYFLDLSVTCILCVRDKHFLLLQIQHHIASFQSIRFFANKIKNSPSKTPEYGNLIFIKVTFFMFASYLLSIQSIAAVLRIL